MLKCATWKPFGASYVRLLLLLLALVAQSSKAGQTALHERSAKGRLLRITHSIVPKSRLNRIPLLCCIETYVLGDDEIFLAKPAEGVIN